MNDKDRDYFAGRAATEAGLAVSSPSALARSVHAEMARLYTRTGKARLRVVGDVEALAESGARASLVSREV